VTRIEKVCRIIPAIALSKKSPFCKGYKGGSLLGKMEGINQVSLPAFLSARGVFFNRAERGGKGVSGDEVKL